MCVAGKVALDAGASTGGFTDCLLQRGAAQVISVDVGHGQLLTRLRDDPRVEVMEKANVRYLRPEDVGGRRFDVVVADLSFISLMIVAQALLGLAKPGADLVVLVKPQFEAGKAIVSKGKGVVRDPKVWAGVLCDVAGAFEAGGAAVVGGMASPLLGAEGNVEFFLHMRTGKKPGLSLVASSLSEIAFAAGPPGPGGGTEQTGLERARLNMATIGFAPNSERASAVELAKSTAAWLEDVGHETVMFPDHTPARPDGGRATIPGAEDLDLLVSLGGDGTMLRAVGLVLGADVPVLGVNFGRFGYLAAVEPDGLHHAIERFLAGDYDLERRMTVGRSRHGERDQKHPVPVDGAQRHNAGPSLGHAHHKCERLHSGANGSSAMPLMP